jgi:hypothetical protein
MASQILFKLPLCQFVVWQQLLITSIRWYLLVVKLQRSPEDRSARLTLGCSKTDFVDSVEKNIKKNSDCPTSPQIHKSMNNSTLGGRMVNVGRLGMTSGNRFGIDFH